MQKSRHGTIDENQYRRESILPALHEAPKVSHHMTLYNLVVATHASLLKSLYKSLRDDVLYRRQVG